MSLRELNAAYRQNVTPLVNLCWATALGTAVVAGVAASVDKLITPWPIALGMLCVSGFYLVLGVGYLIQHKMSAAPPAVASASPPAPLCIKLEGQPIVHDLADEEHVPSPEREMAEV
jgi:hypothetical protein